MIIIPADPDAKLIVWASLLRVAEEVEAIMLVEVIKAITDLSPAKMFLGAVGTVSTSTILTIVFLRTSVFRSKAWLRVLQPRSEISCRFEGTSVKELVNARLQRGTMSVFVIVGVNPILILNNTRALLNFVIDIFQQTFFWKNLQPAIGKFRLEYLGIKSRGGLGDSCNVGMVVATDCRVRQLEEKLKDHQEHEEKDRNCPSFIGFDSIALT